MSDPRLTQIAPPQGEMKKAINPKDAIGSTKPRLFSALPWNVIQTVSVALMEGARKYGRHNWRVMPIQSSIYVDAAMSHMAKWYEGEDIDPDSGLNHIDKAIAGLVILRDADMRGMMIDDRPPATDMSELQDQLQPIVDALQERHPTPKAPYTQKDA